MPNTTFSALMELSSLSGANGFKLNGEAIFDYSGYSVSAAGDVNADEVDDLIIGANGADPDGKNGAGSSYVVFGQVGIASTNVFELATLNGTNGFKLNGELSYDSSGSSVSAAGDVNADGVDDLIIGAYGASPNGKIYAGRSYVVFGRARIGSAGVFNLFTLNGTNGFKLNGEAAGDYSGYSVSAVGDVNADGVDDVIIGARYASPNGKPQAGISYVVFGQVGIGSTGVFNLSTLNGTNGFKLNGEVSGDFSGYSVSAAGDVNADGVDDVIIGARYASPNGKPQAGISYVVFGQVGIGSTGVLELSALNGINGFKINGEAILDHSGASVSAAGDVNADGVEDMIIGAYQAAPNGKSGAGRSYVVFGQAGIGRRGVLELSALNGTNGFKINGEVAGDFSGYSVSAAGDVNADGVDDLIIGAYNASSIGNFEAGSSYMVFGQAGIGSTGVLELSTLNEVNGFKLNGEAIGDNSGYSVSAVGDVNADEVDDVMIGAPYAAPNSYVGSSYVVFGNTQIALVNNTLRINQGQVLTLTSAEVAAMHPDPRIVTFRFFPQDLQHGQFELVTAPGIPIANFTSAQIQGGAIQFAHDGGEIAPSYSVKATVDGRQAGPIGAANIDFNLAPYSRQQSPSY